MVAAGVYLALLTTGAPITPQQADFFEAKIRPVLAEKCFSCHGPKKQSAGLRLDTEAGFLEGADSGKIVVPGNPEQSPLVRVIRHDGRIKMPPREKLPDEAIAVLTAWVKMGAPWPKTRDVVKQSGPDGRKHWAFQPIHKPELPKLRGQEWVKTPIDAFILARLEAKSLSPAPPVERKALLRRATFDLIGLPPTPEEVAAFEADTSPDAYARALDRLLASPHYGERWGRHWLDVARYADTKGYVFFQETNFTWAYTYRDYVIESLNHDLPYDQFILQQLAADLLPLGNERRPLRAEGFLTLGARFMNNRHDQLDDIIDVTTRGLLGLTVSCARCHDHKYDPIPSADYYSLYGVFASTEEPPVPPLYEPPPQTDAYKKFDEELRKREKTLTDFVVEKHGLLVKGARSRVAEYLLAAHALRDQPNQTDFMLLADTNDLNPTMIRRWHAYLERTAKKHHAVFAPWHALAALRKDEFAKKAADEIKKWADKPPAPINPLIARALAAKPITSMEELARRYSEALNGVDKRWTDLVAATPKGQKPPVKMADAHEEELRRVFYGADTAPDIAVPPLGDLALLPDRASQAVLQKHLKELEKWRATGPGAPPRALVLQDKPTPFEPWVFVRGTPGNRGPNVPRQFLGVLAGEKRKPFEHGSGRLELARAIVDPQNPLTARVMVNRVWLHHFGEGLVRTPSDFGLRSEPPSHPELLDFLASYFVENGWSLKKLHRLIMLSSAYQQASHDRPECVAVDPENRLLWKYSRQRLDFEALRDALLAVAGKLDRTIGGPSVGNVTGNNRRTLYGMIDRQTLPGLYRIFDFPSPDATSPQRSNTTVPQQALFLMNNGFVQSAARNLMNRPDVAGKKTLAERVETLYRILYARPAAPEEVILAREYLGASPGEPAWTAYAQALLMSNEFAFVD